MVSCGISYQICSNFRAMGSTYPGRRSLLPFISQDMFDWRDIWRSGWSKKCLTGCKPIHSNTCLMWSGIILLKRNGSKTFIRMSLTYLCAVSVSLITSKEVQLSKEMTSQTITIGQGPV
ncbi:hypothetical protein TNCV_4533951 [Trichonephila clavipes]|nr:hypothetical protein TNCV_4533951 [Trichonephila clavipes]